MTICDAPPRSTAASAGLAGHRLLAWTNRLRWWPVPASIRATRHQRALAERMMATPIHLWHDLPHPVPGPPFGVGLADGPYDL
ncbi:hypothetical protein [Streptomyces sp. NPDC048489]|uniref:hypothetical protein n=1 Tax=Streptomyces sp. NPDC048489 TaxID=3154504 RepID=UPI0034158DDB